MRMLALALAALLLFASCANAGEVLINGADKPVPKNSFAEVSVSILKGDQVGWRILPKPTKMVDNKDGKLYFNGPPGATYTVFVTIVNFGKEEGSITRFDQGEATIKIEGIPPPNPDVDPLVEPEVVKPDLLTDLRGAFKYEPMEEKVFAVEFAAMYSSASTKYVDASTTWGDLFKVMSEDIAARKAEGKLISTQRAVQAYLQSSLPWKGVSDTPISVAEKVKAKSVFNNVSSAFSKLK